MNVETQQTDTSKQTSQTLNVPIAIIIAGGLIAVALYFSGGNTTSSTAPEADTTNTGNTGKTAAAPAQPAVGEVRGVTADDHIRGPANAKVTVVEYVDLECPFCKRFHPTMQQLLKEYPNDVRWVYRHFPLDALHSKARKEAEATECAVELGGNDKFWAYVDRLFEVTPSNDGLDLLELPKIAEYIGLNRTQFESCLASGKYASHIQEDLDDAQTAGGRGTPYSVVIAPNGEKFPINGAQPYASVKQIVDQALAAK